jgi:methenyltetrahydrofolate cyclohydrolase
MEDSTLDVSATIEAFLTATAARRPTPGGGSVTALAAALAAAQAQMVLNYSLGKKELAAHQAELKSVLDELTRARLLLSGLISEDQAAYLALAAARKLPPGPQREHEFAAALQNCLNVPQTVAAAALAVLELCDRVVEKVNHHLLSDLAVAADLCAASVRCAVYNVEVNLADLPPGQPRQEVEDVNRRTVQRCLALIERLMPRISNRLAAAAKGANP